MKFNDQQGAIAASALAPGDQDTVTLRRNEELKKELKKLVNSITEEDDDRIELYDRCSDVIAFLKDIKFKKQTSSGNNGRVPASPSEMLRSAVPDQFLCPISSKIMENPVIVASGETYDRESIEPRLQAGNRRCPMTKQALRHSNLTPNNLLQRMIKEWYESCGLEVPMRAAAINGGGDESGVTESEGSGNVITHEEQRFCDILLGKLVEPNECRTAVEELRELTKTKPSHRAYLGYWKTGAIPLLVSLLLSPDSETQEHAVTVLLNLSLCDENITAIVAHGAIPGIVKVLQNGLTMEARGNAAAALFCLTKVDENRTKIGMSGAIPALIDLLAHGNLVAKKDIVSALHSLCLKHENIITCVREGMIPVLLKLVSNHNECLVLKSLALLAMVSTFNEAAEAMGHAGAVSCLMDIIKFSSSPRNKANAVISLYAICWNDQSYYKEFLTDRNGYINALTDLSKSGIPRAKRNASAILDGIMRQEHISTILARVEEEHGPS